MKHAKRNKLTVEDVNFSLRLTGVEPLHGYRTATEPPKFLRVPDHKDLFYLENRDLDFNTIISSETPICPKECKIGIHWLAVEGIQPNIPQNPKIQYSDQEEQPTKVRKLTSLDSPAPPPQSRPPPKPPTRSQHTITAPERNTKIIPAAPHELSKEFQLFIQKAEESINRLGSLLYSAYEQPSSQPKDDFAVEKKSFDKIFNPSHSKTSGPLGLFVTTLHSLENDATIQKLLPHWAKFVLTSTSAATPSLPVLKGVMQATTALFCNQHIQFDTHLPQFVPAILTCILRPQLAKDQCIENHWHLRDFSSHLLSHIIAKYSKRYNDLERKIVSNLVSVILDNNQSPATHYGAIRALSLLGKKYVTQLLLGILAKFKKRLDSKLKETKNPQPIREALFCWNAVIETFGRYLTDAYKSLDINPHFKTQLQNRYRPAIPQQSQKLKKKKKKPSGNPSTPEEVKIAFTHYTTLRDLFQTNPLLPYLGAAVPLLETFI